MTALSLVAMVEEDGVVHIPHEAIEALGLQPGDTVQVHLETNTLSASEGTLAESLAELLGEAQQLQPFPGPPLTDPYEAAFPEILKQKYNKQGLKLSERKQII